VRITQRAVSLTSLQGLNRNLDAVGRLQQQLTSGRLISNPSDSPTGTNRAMQTRAEQAAVEQQGRAITDGQNWLERTDSTLRSMLDATRRVRYLTVQGASTGSASATSREALAKEVASIQEGLLSLANSRLQGRPLFGGSTSGTDAYTAAGTWVGLPGDVLRRVSENESVRVDITGPEAFGTGTDDLFAVVGRIATDLTANPAALGGHLGDLDKVFEGMLKALADVGTRAARLETAALVNSDRAIALTAQLSETENIDLPETIMKLEMQKVGYQAALKATASAIQPTLLDFLR
jgi:flagellin-like hook-associated protein FlgL